MYIPGREYSKHHLPKGKTKVGKLYRREKRDSENVPESRPKILQFIKDHNKVLKHFIDETEEEGKSFSVGEPEKDEDDDRMEEYLDTLLDSDPEDLDVDLIELDID